MSDWPDGWYRNTPRQQGSFQADDGPGEAPATVPSASRSGWPAQPPPLSQPRRAEPGPYRSGRRWRFWGQPGRRGRRIALIVGLVVVVVLAAGAGSYFWLDSKLNRSVVLPASAVTSAGQNWLIAGSDSRQGLTAKQERQLATGHDIGGHRSDTVMILHIPANGGPSVLVSLPRDSYVPIPGYGDNKLNAAFSFGGPKLLAKTVQNVTGLRIDHYMEIGFGGFVHVVDAVGGVRMCLKTSLYDQASGARLKKGCQTLDGDQALAYVRTRHNFSDQDLQRVQDQRLFMRALLTKLTSPGVILNPFASVPAALGVANTVTVDQGTSLYQLIKAAFALRHPETTTVPIANSNYATAAGDAVQWNSAEATQLFNDLKNDQPVPKSLLTGSKQAP